MIERELGRGSFGVVFLVRRQGRDEQYALKVHTGPRDRESLIRLQLEAEVINKLDHPGIVQVRDHGTIDGRDYLLLDYCEGEGLDERLSAGPLPWAEAAALVREVARTMAAAHAQGVLHRDLKPGNVIIEAASGAPKLIDFGLARDRSLVQSLTQSRVTMGTPVTMPPEQLRGAKRVDERSDVYALGALLYWCLSGRPPFEADSMLELERQICTADPLPPSAAVPGIPPELERVCLRALAKSPAGRPVDAGAFVTALDAALAGDAPPARAAGSRLATVLTLAVVLLSLGVAGALVWRARSPSAGAADAEPVAGADDPRRAAVTAGLERVRTRAHAFAPLAELRQLLDAVEAEAAGDPALLAEVRLARADACRRRGDYQAAIEAAPVEAPGRVGLKARWLRGLCYLRTGRDRQALEVWRALVADDPTGVSGLDAKAILMIIDGDDRWAEVGQQCEQADPTNYHARIVGAYGRWRLESPEAALADLEAIGRDEPDDTHVHFVRAFILSGLGETEAAREAYGEVLRRTAPFASHQALEGRALNAMRQQQWALALEDLDRLLTIDPYHVPGLLFGGLCRWALGQQRAARDDWATACRYRDPTTWERELRQLPPDLAETLREQAAEVAPEPPPNR